MQNNELPFSLTVKEMAKILGINVTSAYELTRREDFNCSIKIGNRIIVNRDLFLKWLEQESQKPFALNGKSSSSPGKLVK